MVKISRIDNRFSTLKNLTLIEGNILERKHLQEFIWNSQESFCREIGRNLLIIGKEVEPSEMVGDRIDLLAIDESGSTVIFELKRGNDKLQLFQAISYAAMIAGLKLGELLELRNVNPTRAADIGNFVNADNVEDAVNRDQQLVLVAEDFDYEVLAGAEWLYENYDVGIACVRVALVQDVAASTEYLSFTQIFPTHEIEEVAKLRGRRGLRAANAEGQVTAKKKYTTDDLLKLADDHQILPAVSVCRRLNGIWDEWPSQSSLGVSFLYSKVTPNGWRSLCKVFVASEKSASPPGQLDVFVVTKNLAEVTGQDENVMRATLKEHHHQVDAKKNYCILRLSTPEQAEALVTQLNEWWDHRPQPSVTKPTEKVSERATGG